MVEAGFQNVGALEGGWRNWYRNQYPVEEK